MCSRIEVRLTSALQVQIAPKKDILYSTFKSKFVALYHRMIATSENEKDLEYFRSGASTSTPAAWSTRGTSQKVVLSVVAASQPDKECTLTDSPYGDASSSERASGPESFSASRSAHSPRSNACTAYGCATQGGRWSKDHDHQALSDKAKSLEPTPTPWVDETEAIDEELNWWCLDGQH